MIREKKNNLRNNKIPPFKYILDSNIIYHKEYENRMFTLTCNNRHNNMNKPSR